jgi:phage baseplate assembly protein gpV
MRLANIMRQEAERAGSRRSFARRAIVSAYDPASYCAKVRIQPEDVETGWIPVGSPWVGSNWGLFCPPTPGDEVDVHFQEGGKNAEYISLRFYGDAAPPVAVQSGEFWLVHKSGSFLKFRNNGDIEFHAAGKVIGSAEEFDFTGNVKVTGDIRATGDIYDLDSEQGSVGHIREIFNIHTHYETDSVTHVPNQQL